MNKWELIDKYKELLEEHSPFHELVPYTSMLELFLKDLKQLDEPQKVKIPKFVADWICYAKGWNKGLYYALANTSEDVLSWFQEDKLKRQEIFAQAWIFGYKVEKEKRYRVRVKGICGKHETLNRERHSEKWLFSDREENALYDTKFTRKELEDFNFSWVFDCPGIEIEEVTE